MRFLTAVSLAAIALSPLAIATTASAQDRDAAVHRCLQQARTQYPGSPAEDPSLDRNRTAVYKACMTQAGFAP